MKPLDISRIYAYVNQHIDQFHERRIAVISTLSLNKLVEKNPYLFRAKNTTTANELIVDTLEAFLSSSEEKMFGDFLEGLAIEVASQTTDGHKSSAEGMDLEFIDQGVYYIVSIKSGPNWGNSSQHAKLKQDFNMIERRLKQSDHVQSIQKVLGICYGNAKTSMTRDGYLKVVGQNFWTLISGDQHLYIDIVDPIGYKAKEHNDAYLVQKAKIINVLTRKFLEEYCNEEGLIDWPKLLETNSGNFDLDQFITRP